MHCMESEFLPHNMHLNSIGVFKRNDPHLRRMHMQQYIFHSPIIDQLPTKEPGIYNLAGGRQIGKTTLLKQWMLLLLKSGVNPSAVAFLSCELLVDEHSLYRVVNNQLSDMPHRGLRYLILDEITYVSNWDKAIKYLADLGVFEQVVLVISGSDITMMQEARKRFPGRRGQADQVDFHYYPLSFRQTLALKGVWKRQWNTLKKPTQAISEQLFDALSEYMIHGGFLTAINEYAMTKSISNRTLATYSDWIRGDVIKHDKKEHYLREIMQGILKHYSSQISWRNLVSELSINHAQTAIDYVDLLESMDAVFISSALIENKLVGAPKKNRKLMFCDPFIFHAARAWLQPTQTPFNIQILDSIKNTKIASQLVETIVITHCRQHFPTYYIKGNGEVDLAYVHDGKFWPIEVKWTNQLRSLEAQQIMKYKNGCIWTKVKEDTEALGMPILSLPWALATEFEGA